ncbi:MAG: DUF2284 domain-containing protein [Syntrophomonadaceae bacterium]|nr:DUF2284 domain-containing protein [Syntrophomonadaceae bacterium]
MTAEKQLSHDELAGLIDYALELGLTRARRVETGDIVVKDEVVYRWCAGCPEYGRNLSCPPAVEPPEKFRQFLGSYRFGMLVQLSHRLKEDPAAAGYGEAYELSTRLHLLLLALEDFCRENGYPRARCFIGGCCRLCGTCPGPGNHCLNPREARSSMEANGISVVETCAAAGWPLEFPVKDQVTWTGLVLLD